MVGKRKAVHQSFKGCLAWWVGKRMRAKPMAKLPPCRLEGGGRLLGGWIFLGIGYVLLQTAIGHLLTSLRLSVVKDEEGVEIQHYSRANSSAVLS